MQRNSITGEASPMRVPATLSKPASRGSTLPLNQILISIAAPTGPVTLRRGPIRSTTEACPFRSSATKKKPEICSEAWCNPDRPRCRIKRQQQEKPQKASIPTDSRRNRPLHRRSWIPGPPEPGSRKNRTSRGCRIEPGPSGRTHCARQSSIKLPERRHATSSSTSRDGARNRSTRIPL